MIFMLERCLWLKSSKLRFDRRLKFEVLFSTICIKMQNTNKPIDVICAASGL